MKWNKVSDSRSVCVFKELEIILQVDLIKGIWYWSINDVQGGSLDSGEGLDQSEAKQLALCAFCDILSQAFNEAEALLDANRV